MINANENNDTNNELPINENPKHFFTDDNYAAIRKIQSEIYEATEVKLTFRKIINKLITSDTLEKVKVKIIKNINECLIN